MTQDVPAHTASPEAVTGGRKAVRQFPVTVSAAVNVAPAVRRLTLDAPEFGSYVCTGPDEYFGLLVPRAGQRDALRWYTFRNHRPEACQIDVDIVVHGGDAPGSAFALQATPGTLAAFRVGGADYTLPAPGQHHVIVADETSAPAAAAMIDAAVARHGGTSGPLGSAEVVVEVPDLDHLTPLDVDGAIAAGWTVTVLQRGASAPGALVIDFAKHSTATGVDFAWVCGESKLATTLRRHFVSERGLDRKAVAFSGYWRHSG